jgi:hypothetical protein
MIPTRLLIPMLINKPLLILEPQSNSKNRKKLLDNLIMDMSREPLDTIPLLAHNIGMRTIRVLRREFWDIVNLEIIFHPRDKRPDTRGLPAVVVALFERCAVFLFFFGGQGQDGFCDCELGVDLGFWEAVVCYVEEACRASLIYWGVQTGHTEGR